jgi:hypothetical protein
MGFIKGCIAVALCGLTSLAAWLCGTLSSIVFGLWLLKLCVPALFVGTAIATYPLGMLVLKLTLACIGLALLTTLFTALVKALDSADKQASRTNQHQQTQSADFLPRAGTASQQNRTFISGGQGPAPAGKRMGHAGAI